MGNVTPLPGFEFTLPEDESDPEIVEALEKLLEKAKAGQVRAIAWCTYNRADTISRGWVDGAYGFHIAAAITMLQHDYGVALSAGDA